MRWIPAAIIVVLTGCGGGGSSSDPLFADYNALTGGGFSTAGALISDTSDASSLGCAYQTRTNTREGVSSEVRSRGGTVTVSTDDAWCGEAGNQSVCLFRIGDTFVLEQHDGDVESVDITMTSVESGRITIVEFEAYGPSGFGYIDSGQKDVSVLPDTESCNSPPTMATLESVNGNWTGNVFNYAGAASEETAGSATCTNLSCTFPDVIDGAITLDSYDSFAGVWRGQSTGQVAAAAISPDGALLSMYICSNPLTERLTLANCKFASLRKF